MSYRQLLSAMFTNTVNIKEQNNILKGDANYFGVSFILCGVVNSAALDNAMCCDLAQFILEEIKQKPKTNFIFFVDTSGQQTTHFAELIGLNRYMAHLAKTLHYARSIGARVFGVVYGKALGGAFIATALNAEKIYALNSAQIAVMWLDAMSRVTKVPLEKLQQLSETSPIFAPGAENFVKLGAVEAVLAANQIMPQIIRDLADLPDDINQWRIKGQNRGGRSMSNTVVDDVLNA